MITPRATVYQNQDIGSPLRTTWVSCKFMKTPTTISHCRRRTRSRDLQMSDQGADTHFVSSPVRCLLVCLTPCRVHPVTCGDISMLLIKSTRNPIAIESVDDAGFCCGHSLGHKETFNALTFVSTVIYRGIRRLQDSVLHHQKGSAWRGTKFGLCSSVLKVVL